MSDRLGGSNKTAWHLELDIAPLLDRLKHLPEKVQTKALKTATRKAVTLQQKLVKYATPVHLGALRSSWKVKAVRYRVRGVIGFKARPDSRFRRVRIRKRDGTIKLATQRRSKDELAKNAALGITRTPTVRPSKYAHLVEFGHKIRRKKGGRVYGRTMADNFAARTVQDSELTVRGIFGTILKRFLDIEQHG